MKPRPAKSTPPTEIDTEASEPITPAKLDPATREKALRWWLAHHPGEVLMRARDTLRADARTGSATSALLLRSVSIREQAPKPYKSNRRKEAVSVSAAIYLKRCVEGVRSGKAHIHDAALRKEIEGLPKAPSQAFERWWRAAWALHCLAFLQRAPAPKTWEQDVFASLELDEQLVPLMTGSLSGKRKPLKQILARVKDAAMNHW